MKRRWPGLRGFWAGLVLALATLAPAASAQPLNPFGDWVAVVVAADYRDHDGRSIKVFDNARIDMVKALVGVGFSPSRIAQFSVRPQLFEDMPHPVDPPIGLYDALYSLTRSSSGGCLLYLTSHGGPDGVVYGKRTLTPADLDGVLDRTCAERPTVAIISACFSGVFIPALAGPNRMVVTAARADRASFGCAADETYTYFDACVLESLPTSARLDVLAEQARACVARRETETGMAPPSEPQISIGAEIAKRLPALTLVARPSG